MSDLWIATVESAVEPGVNGLGSQFIGELAALAAAFLWAAATLLFGKLGRQLSPLVLNLIKGVFAVVLIGITIAARYFLGTDTTGDIDLPLDAITYLMLSGGIGIGLGDTAYFSAINALGARRALLLETLAPPVAAVLAWIFLSERLSIVSILGIGLTLVGIAWVISERVPGSVQVKWGAGLKVALLAVFCQASGAVLSRAALLDASVDPLWSSLLRLLSGLVFMATLAKLQPHRLGDYLSAEASDYLSAEASDYLSDYLSAEARSDMNSWQARWRQSLSALRQPSLLGAVALAAFFGTYLGIWLQQISLKYTAAGIAQSLLATSPLFVLPLAAALGERISLRAILGAALALSGVWILLAG